MKKIIDGIKQLIENERKKEGSKLQYIQTVYWGDPVSIPYSNQPAVTIDYLGSDIKEQGDATRKYIHHLLIKLIVNKKDYIGSVNLEYAKVHALDDILGVVQDGDSNNDIYANTLVGLLDHNSGLPYNGVNTVETSLVTQTKYEMKDKPFEAYVVEIYLDALSFGGL